MANNQNPEDVLAREGRLAARPSRRWPTVTVAKIDIDTVWAYLTTTINRVFQTHTPLRRLYNGTNAEVTAQITADVNALCDQAMAELWNRLRTASESLHRPTFQAVFTRKAPTYDGFTVPRIVASLLSSIGPLRITDSFRDTVVIYAPDPANNNNFGRAVPFEIAPLNLLRIIQNMRDANIPTGTIQNRGSQGSFFTTTEMLFNEDSTYELVGSFHSSHYTRNDIIMAMFFNTRQDEGNPFEDFSLSLGFVSDEAAVAALKAVALDDAEEDDPPRLVQADYPINRMGLTPAGSQPVTTRGEGFYVLGRGYSNEYITSLARNISTMEIEAILAHRILHQAGGDPPAINHAPGVGANHPVPN